MNKLIENDPSLVSIVSAIKKVQTKKGYNDKKILYLCRRLDCLFEVLKELPKQITFFEVIITTNFYDCDFGFEFDQDKNCWECVDHYDNETFASNTAIAQTLIDRKITFKKLSTNIVKALEELQ